MNIPLAPLGAAVLGVAAALGVAVMPGEVLESLVLDSGLPSVLAAAEPPLGLTARVALSLGTGLLVAAFSWLSLFILFGSQALTLGEADAGTLELEEAAVPTIRRADAHPDAPPRPPLLATRDLGTPFLDVRVKPERAAEPDLLLEKRIALAESAPEPEPEPAPQPAFIAAEPVKRPVAPEQPIPVDLDQRLASYDPASIRENPIAQPVPLAPLRRQRPSIFNENERFEIFELTPPIRRHVPRSTPIPAPTPPAEPISRPETDASVHALLERLERGVSRTGLGRSAREPQPRQAERGLEDALATLRNLARRTA